MSPKDVRKTIRRIRSKYCPFCGEKELFVYAPSAHRSYAVVGCQSLSCDSSWRMCRDTLDQVEQRINHAHKLCIQSRRQLHKA